MRINGDAYRVDVGTSELSGSGVLITQGEDFEGMHVAQIMVGLEDEICHIKLVSQTHERHLTFQKSEVKVDWNSPPNLQSRTEWTLWLAEVIGHSQGMAAVGLEPELRKFYPKDQMPQPGQQPAPVDQGYRPIPLNPRGRGQGPQLPPLPQNAVRGPGEPTIQPKGGTPAVPEGNVTDVRDYMKRQARQQNPAAQPASSTRKPVDSDAGGPEGFDPDLANEAPPIPVEVARMEKDPKTGQRVIKVPGKPKGLENVDLTGRQIMAAGELLTVESVELSEEDGKDVLIMRVS